MLEEKAVFFKTAFFVHIEYSMFAKYQKLVLFFQHNLIFPR